jgi:hypothetical protein
MEYLKSRSGSSGAAKHDKWMALSKCMTLGRNLAPSIFQVFQQNCWKADVLNIPVSLLIVFSPAKPAVYPYSYKSNAQQRKEGAHGISSLACQICCIWVIPRQGPSDLNRSETITGARLILINSKCNFLVIRKVGVGVHEGRELA